MFFFHIYNMVRWSNISDRVVCVNVDAQKLKENTVQPAYTERIRDAKTVPYFRKNRIYEESLTRKNTTT